MILRLLGLLEGFSRLTHGIGVYLGLPVLTGILTADVFLRYVFNAPLKWGNEVGALLLLVVFFGSLTHCTARREHVRMDILYDRFGPGGKRLTDALAALCGLTFAVPLSIQSALTTLEAYRLNHGAEMLDLPYWPFTLLMSVCGLALALECGRQGLTALRGGTETREGR
jgi:TRAP-type C4-dicarboxylate transport system permease small subunit